MISVPKEVKNDPVRRWNLPDRIFFAAGACHILAYVFLQKYSSRGFKPYWIKPESGFTGNHIFVSDGTLAFDYRGYTQEKTLLKQILEDMTTHYPGWCYELIEIEEEALISEELSKSYEGLWLREPGKFLHNPMGRAESYLSLICNQE